MWREVAVAEYDVSLGGVLERLRKTTGNMSFEPGPSEYETSYRVGSDRYIRTIFNSKSSYRVFLRRAPLFITFAGLTLRNVNICDMSGIRIPDYLAAGIGCQSIFNPLNPELNPICYFLALLGAYHFLHLSRIRVKLLTFRLLMSYIYIYIWSTHSCCF